MAKWSILTYDKYKGLNAYTLSKFTVARHDVLDL